MSLTPSVNDLCLWIYHCWPHTVACSWYCDSGDLQGLSFSFLLSLFFPLNLLQQSRTKFLSTGKIWNKICEYMLYMSHIMRKPIYAIYDKGADQLAHLRRLISVFVVRCLDSIVPLVSISQISSLYLVSVTAQTSLSLTWSQIPKKGFLVAHIICYKGLSSYSECSCK